jgi:hypothetical protein
MRCKARAARGSAVKPVLAQEAVQVCTVDAGGARGLGDVAAGALQEAAGATLEAGRPARSAAAGRARGGAAAVRSA